MGVFLACRRRRVNPSTEPVDHLREPTRSLCRDEHGVQFHTSALVVFVGDSQFFTVTDASLAFFSIIPFLLPAKGLFFSTQLK